MSFDIDTIITHLDNFVDTWEGWNDVITGLNGIFDIFTGEGSSEAASSVVDTPATELSSAFEALSSDD